MVQNVDDAAGTTCTRDHPVTSGSGNTGSLVIHSATSNDIGDAHPVHNGNALGLSCSEQRSSGIPNFEVAEPLHDGEHKEELYATLDTTVDPKWESGWPSSEDNTCA